MGAENSGGRTDGAGRCAEIFGVQTGLPKGSPKLPAAEPAAPEAVPKISAVKPVCRNEFVKNWTNPNFAIREIDGENDQLTAGNAKGRWRITQIMISMDQNQKKLTQMRDRSETKYRLFLGNFQIFGGK